MAKFQLPSLLKTSQNIQKNIPKKTSKNTQKHPKKHTKHIQIQKHPKHKTTSNNIQEKHAKNIQKPSQFLSEVWFSQGTIHINPRLPEAASGEGHLLKRGEFTDVFFSS